MNEPVLIWGAGAIGGILGAYWARAGIPVLMVDIVSDHVTACATTGLSIEGSVEEFTQVVPCVTPEELTGTYSRIVLAVKAQATSVALAQLMPHLASNGFVLSAQNGLNERVIAQHIRAERTMGAFVNYGADWIGPGRILFGNRGAVVVGEIDGTIKARTREMFDLLQVFEPNAVLSDDIWAYLWGKLGYGAMLFATALTPDSMTENFADPTRGPALIGLAREVMQTAVAEALTPNPSTGLNPAHSCPVQVTPPPCKASLIWPSSIQRQPRPIRGSTATLLCANARPKLIRKSARLQRLPPVMASMRHCCTDWSN